MSKQTTKWKTIPFTVYYPDIDESEQLSKAELLERYAFRLGSSVYVECYGFKLDLERLSDTAIRELTKDVIPEDTFDQMEPANKQEFYRALFDRWLEWKQRLGDTHIQVDEYYDEDADDTILYGFR